MVMDTHGTDCNGWPDRDTWRLQLHLANNEALANYCARVATTIGHQWVLSVPEQHAEAVREVAAMFEHNLSAAVRRAYPAVDNDGLPMFVADTMDAALGRVDWQAIARVWLERAEVAAS
jgi:hypothetical protein